MSGSVSITMRKVIGEQALSVIVAGQCMVIQTLLQHFGMLTRRRFLLQNRSLITEASVASMSGS